MIGNESGQEKFVQETKAYDSLRNQSITKMLPELNQFFALIGRCFRTALLMK